MVELMPLVRIEASGFPPEYGHLNDSWDENWWTSRVALGAFLMGRHPRDRFQFGPYSIVDMLHRVSLVWANLRCENSRLVQSGVYEIADRSEKAGISYALGQTFAHLFLTRFLGVPYTMHVDRYAEEFGVRWTGRGQWKPDLMGLGRGWVVAEAKGRTWGARGVLEHAAQQKAAIETIGGEPPAIRLASIVHFATGPLSLLVSDPKPPEPPTEIPGNRAAFLRSYYRPIVEATRGGYRRRLFGRAFRLVDFDGLDLSIGIETDVARAYSSSDESLVGLAERSNDGTASREQADELRAIGADGVALVLGATWTEDSLSMEPRERRRPRG